MCVTNMCIAQGSLGAERSPCTCLGTGRTELGKRRRLIGGQDGQRPSTYRGKSWCTDGGYVKALLSPLTASLFTLLLLPAGDSTINMFKLLKIQPLHIMMRKQGLHKTSSCLGLQPGLLLLVWAPSPPHVFTAFRPPQCTVPSQGCSSSLDHFPDT